MTARRAAAALLFLAALVMLWVAALTPLRSAEIAEMDAEAERLGIEWAEHQGNQDLAARSNEFYAAARDLEPPLAPLAAIGGALLLAAAGVALWPPRPER